MTYEDKENILQRKVASLKCQRAIGQVIIPQRDTGLTGLGCEGVEPRTIVKKRVRNPDCKLGSQVFLITVGWSGT